jgi:hypothetical protein
LITPEFSCAIVKAAVRNNVVIVRKILAILSYTFTTNTKQKAIVHIYPHEVGNWQWTVGNPENKS